MILVVSIQFYAIGHVALATIFDITKQVPYDFVKYYHPFEGRVSVDFSHCQTSTGFSIEFQLLVEECRVPEWYM